MSREEREILADVEPVSPVLEEPERTRRPLSLFPRIGLLTLLNAVVWSLPLVTGGASDGLHRTLLSAFSFVSIIYVALIVLKVRDALKQPERLHCIDAVILSCSGPLAFTIAVLLMRYGLAMWRAAGSAPWPAAVLRHAVYSGFEVGFVLAVACIQLPRDYFALPPRHVWWGISLLLAVILGMYTLLLPLVWMARQTGTA